MFVERFPFFSRVLGASVGIENPCFWWVSLINGFRTWGRIIEELEKWPKICDAIGPILK